MAETENQKQNQNNTNNENNNLIIKIDNLLYLHSSDHSSLALVSDLLTYKNYTGWSMAMVIALEAKDKLGFVNGEIATPDENDLTFKQWRKVNSTLIYWILSSMTKELSRGFMFARNTKLLWDEIRDRFGVCNGPPLYELRRSLYSAKQRVDYVGAYYNRIKKYWDELTCLKPSLANADEDKERMM